MTNYQLMDSYPVATIILLKNNGQLVMKEEYFDVSFPEDLDPLYLIPKISGRSGGKRTLNPIFTKQTHNTMTLEEQKYPIGRFQKPKEITNENIRAWKAEISSLPARFKETVKGLSNEQLDTPYREGGWTVRQVVNHCADSHMNALLRIKLALTEDRPTVSAYFEERWAELEDSKGMPIEPALQMLQGIHDRWTILLNSLSEKQLEQSFIHPSHGREVQIKEVLALYAWHGNHHLAHVEMLKNRRGWE